MSGYSKKLNLSKELLEELYKTLTIEKIAEELGVNEKTIRRRFKEYNIQTGIHTSPLFIKKHSKPKKPKLKKVLRYKIKEDFEKVYNETKSLVLVAKHYNISPDTAFNWKTKHNLATIKGVSEYGLSLINSNKPYTNKEWLEQAYSEYTMPELADKLSLNVCTIKYWIKKLEIKTRTVSEQRAFKSGNGNRTIFSTYTNKFSKENYMDNIPYNLPYTIRDKIFEIVGGCQCCGETEVLDLHHIDQNHHNNLPNNHSVLCPNCHAKIHRLNFIFEEMCPSYKPWDELT